MLNDTKGTIDFELRESHREAIEITHKFGDPTFRLEPIAKLIDQWLHWEIKYKELGKDTR